MIPHDNRDGQILYTIIENIFSMFHVGNLLRNAGAGKLIFILLRKAGFERLTGNGGKQRKLEWPPGRIVKLV